ncbi:MAG TPA: hypothetical protein VGX68_16445 [Thermoanaerobaculia bacterium]|nr:hypothetical protein [Thermoanaerobaculia bacterium]
MSQNRSLRLAFPLFLLLAVLFTSSPANAAPAYRGVAALGEEAVAWIQDLFGSLWMRGAKEQGMSTGGPVSQPEEGMTSGPRGQRKEGARIDPDGNH